MCLLFSSSVALTVSAAFVSAVVIVTISVHLYSIQRDYVMSCSAHSAVFESFVLCKVSYMFY